MNGLLYRELSYAIVGAAMEVHRELGPGFTENIYQKALEQELTIQSIPFLPQYRILVPYKGFIIAEYFLDLVVDGKIVVELKSVSQLAPEHESQVLNYLKASNLNLGLLFNFGEPSLKHKRLAFSLKNNLRNSRN